MGLWGGILEEIVPTENTESRVGTIEERHQPEHKAKTICKQRKKRETKKKDPKKSFPNGRWQPWEHLEFLRGLRVHGKGHWQEIAENIPTRCVSLPQRCFRLVMIVVLLVPLSCYTFHAIVFFSLFSLCDRLNCFSVELPFR